MSLRPTTTAFLPDIVTPVDLMSSMTPLGVQGTNAGSEARLER